MSHKVRASQMITTFGPGSLIDLPDSSVIVGGLDHWHHDPATLLTIEEPRLVAKLKSLLGVESLALKVPPPASDKDHGYRPHVVVWRFPMWFVVQNTVITPRQHRRRRLVHLKALQDMRFRDEDKKNYPVVPVRFVRACRKGHIDDIDWKGYIHGGATACSRALWLEERGTTGDLSEVYVHCDCGMERAMSLAAIPQLRALGPCQGGRPWLGPDRREECAEGSRLLIRSASNAYFSQVMSVISIPDVHEALDAAVRSLWEDFLVDVETLDDLVRFRKKPTVRVQLEGHDDAAVMAAIGRVRTGSLDQERPVKEVEFDALVDARDEIGTDTPHGSFYARNLPREFWDAPHMRLFDRVVLVHRLREVVSQVGFTRFESASPDVNGDLAMEVERAPLAVDASWLPAIENRGEGIFLQVSPAAIRSWMEKPEVKSRGEALFAGFGRWQEDHPQSNRKFPGMPFIALHSLSHLLLTTISLECGYPASSLRERVYAVGDRLGILLFTGSSDAEGTLGGLVQAGRRIRQHVQRALAMAMLCSNDPICAYHVPRDHDHNMLVGSACHGCLLISETSCEQQNDFLDRSLVVPTVEGLSCGLFEDGP